MVGGVVRPPKAHTILSGCRITKSFSQGVVMRTDEHYDHYHEKSSEWFKKDFIKYTNGPIRGLRTAHHHKITEKSTGRTGEGWGWSYKQAMEKAWQDLSHQ
jgi:hypothetical protein